MSERDLRKPRLWRIRSRFTMQNILFVILPVLALTHATGYRDMIANIPLYAIILIGGFRVLDRRYPPVERYRPSYFQVWAIGRLMLVAAAVILFQPIVACASLSVSPQEAAWINIARVGGGFLITACLSAGLYGLIMERTATWIYRATALLLLTAGLGNVLASVVCV